MKNLHKFILAFLVLLVSFVQGQTFPPKPVNPGGGTGGSGTGAPPGSVPIDMYVYVLALIAIVTIVYFAKKYKTQKI